MVKSILDLDVVDQRVLLRQEEIKGCIGSLMELITLWLLNVQKVLLKVDVNTEVT